MESVQAFYLGNNKLITRKQKCTPVWTLESLPLGVLNPHLETASVVAIAPAGLYRINVPHFSVLEGDAIFVLGPFRTSDLNA